MQPPPHNARHIRPPHSPAALITGAAQGLGRAIAIDLAQRKQVGSLFLHYRHSREAAETVAQRCQQAGVPTHLLQADLARIEEREALLTALHARCPRLDLLINNVGVYLDAPLLSITPQAWLHCMESSCGAAHHLIQGCLPLLRHGEQQKNIVNIGDSAADRIQARLQATPYHIAKIGLNVLTRSYAKILGEERIRVNMISPGFLEGSLGEAPVSLPLGRQGKPQDVLQALAYLLSPAAEYVSGANLVVSGGWNC